MKIYLDNCCYNRPFDDQSQMKIHLETQAKLYIQRQIRDGVYDLVWSYDYTKWRENALDEGLDVRQLSQKAMEYAKNI